MRLRKQLLELDEAPARVPLRMAALKSPSCARCGLLHSCRSPKMPPRGAGKRNILVVGEAPGEDEDRFGRPFVGKSGRLLRDCMRLAGADLDTDCVTTNALSCRPPGNEIPEKGDHVAWCRPLVLKAIHEHRPNAILLLGKRAVESVIGWLWKELVGEVGKWAGCHIPSRRLNAWVVPTFHPSYVLRSGGGGNGRQKHVPAEALFKKHIQEVVRLSGSRPYAGEPPDLEALVRCVVDPAQAAVAIRRMMSSGLPVAYDYETDRLKPQHEDARIVCCSVSDGRTSIAFPWHGEAIEAVSELLLSDVPKLGWNIKFEENWTWRALGHGVNNWALDGQLASHVLDNRTGNKSLKFQAFVRLGADSYDDVVKPYFESKSGNARNRVHEIALDKLLLYCGLDSLYEAMLCSQMAKELGVSI